MKKHLSGNKKLGNKVRQGEDHYDILIAESRAKEKSIPFEKVIYKLKKKGRL
jgi:hypothetical protein